jgi:hypothetical protein
MQDTWAQEAAERQEVATAVPGGSLGAERKEPT